MGIVGMWRNGFEGLGVGLGWGGGVGRVLEVGEEERGGVELECGGYEEVRCGYGYWIVR